MYVLKLSAMIVLFGFVAAHGHAGDRVFPFYEITDVTAIDLTDGSIEDWEELFGGAVPHEPWISPVSPLTKGPERAWITTRPTSTSASGSAGTGAFGPHLCGAPSASTTCT